MATRITPNQLRNLIRTEVRKVIKESYWTGDQTPYDMSTPPDAPVTVSALKDIAMECGDDYDTCVQALDDADILVPRGVMDDVVTYLMGYASGEGDESDLKAALDLINRGSRSTHASRPEWMD